MNNLLLLLPKEEARINDCEVIVTGKKRAFEVVMKPFRIEIDVVQYRGKWYTGLNVMMSQSGWGYAPSPKWNEYDSREEAVEDTYESALAMMGKSLNTQDDRRFYKKVQECHDRK